MLAFNNDPTLKASLLAELAKHRKADQISKDQYWENGKGCAVGCTLHSYAILSGRTDFEFDQHGIYDEIFGRGGQMIARLEDVIFENLPNNLAQEWPERLLNAVKVGSDLSFVGWKFLHWLLTDSQVNTGIDHPLVRATVKQCADIMDLMATGAATSVESAESAARSAERSAASAESAAWSAASAERSAAYAARSAAASAAWSAAYVLMSDKLIELIEAA